MSFHDKKKELSTQLPSASPPILPVPWGLGDHMKQRFILPYEALLQAQHLVHMNSFTQ